MSTVLAHEREGVIRNSRRWLNAQGIRLEDTTRVRISYETADYCHYRIVNASHKGEGMTNSQGERADALVTIESNHALFLPVADCVATTLYDEPHHVLMLSHLGRHSLEQQGGLKSVAFLVEHFNTNPANLQVWTSPAPNKEAYPIFKLDGQGMKEALFDQLERAGVLPEHILDNTADTATDDNYFSHSEYQKGNKQVEGRFAMVAVMR